MPPCTKRGPYRNGLLRSAWKNLTGLHRALTSTPSNTFGMNRNADYEPNLIAQHHCPTSRMLLWQNGSKSPQQCSNISWKAFPEEWRLLLQHRGDQLHINAHDFGMRCWTSRCPHTFGHVVYIYIGPIRRIALIIGPIRRIALIIACVCLSVCVCVCVCVCRPPF